MTKCCHLGLQLAVQFGSLAHSLIERSVSLNTHKTYDTAIEKLHEFRALYQLPQVWPVPVPDLLNFVAYLMLQGISASSVSTYMSGIAHAHKISSLNDPTKSFLVFKVLEGLRRLQGGTPRDIRALITLPVLTKVRNCLPFICKSKYEEALFCRLIFFGLFCSFARWGIY